MIGRYTTKKFVPPDTRGSASPNAKLTEAKVRRIRKLYDSGMRATEGGKKFGISGTLFTNIGKRKAWRHV